MWRLHFAAGLPGPRAHGWQFQLRLWCLGVHSLRLWVLPVTEALGSCGTHLYFLLFLEDPSPAVAIRRGYKLSSRLLLRYSLASPVRDRTVASQAVNYEVLENRSFRPLRHTCHPAPVSPGCSDRLIPHESNSPCLRSLDRQALQLAVGTKTALTSKRIAYSGTKYE